MEDAWFEHIELWFQNKINGIITKKIIIVIFFYDNRTEQSAMSVKNFLWMGDLVWNGG